MSRPIRAPELSELETLTLCAAEGSLAAAAAQLGISRPAVAKRIAALEAIVGAPLLERNTRGVRLTAQGVAVVARADRLLAEREALVDEIAGWRAGGSGASRISGVRGLLGRTSSPSSRAAQRPEALLAETEQLFEVVFHASATGIAISDPDTGLVYEVNDAFCAFLGRPRTDVLGHSASEIKAWESPESRERMMERVRRDGVARDVVIRARQPDGSVRVGHATVQLVRLGGRPRLLTAIGDAGSNGRPSTRD